MTTDEIDVTDVRADARGRKAEQSDRTRAALVRVARQLFADRGYAATSTEEVVQQAGVTRGALYHHFRDKSDLFEAVFLEIQDEARDRIRGAGSVPSEFWERFRAGFDEYLNHSMDPSIQRIALIDTPAVLGWERWRELDYTLDLLQGALAGRPHRRTRAPAARRGERGIADDRVRTRRSERAPPRR
jgi:AcrR family transcriptional regulator